MGGFVVFIIDLWMTNAWVRSLATLIVFLSIAQIVLGSMKHYLKREKKRGTRRSIDIIIEKSERPISLMIILIGIKVAVSYLEYNLHVPYRLLDNILVVLGVYFLIVTIDIIIDIWIQKFNERAGRGYEDEVLHLVKAFINVFLVAIGFILILNAWGVSITPFVASLGIIGVAVGFAMQKTLGDFMGSIALVLDRCFRINDLIRLETGEIGYVVDVGLRSTRILTLDREMMIIPNSQMSSIKITNYAKPNNIMRLTVPVDIVYRADPKRVVKIMINSLKGVADILPDPKPEVRFEVLGENGMHFKLLFYIDDYRKRFKAKSIVLDNIHKNLRKAKIDIAYPTRTLHMKKK